MTHPIPIDGTGIFTYMNGWFFMGISCRYIYTIAIHGCGDWDMWGKTKNAKLWEFSVNSPIIGALFGLVISWPLVGKGGKGMHQKLTVFRKVASHLALHQPKKGCKTYSLQYIYSICNISILAGLCQSCHPVLGVLLYESLTISRCFTVSEYQSSSHFARLHATLRCNARKRRMQIFVSKIALLIRYDDIIQVITTTAWFLFQGNVFTEHATKNHFNNKKGWCEFCYQ